MISNFYGKTFFEDQEQVLTSTGFDIPKITLAQLQSKLAHSLLKKVEPKDLGTRKLLQICRNLRIKRVHHKKCIDLIFAHPYISAHGIIKFVVSHALRLNKLNFD